MQGYYEDLTVPKPADSIPDLRLVFHLDYLGLAPGEGLQYPTHWHEWLELLVVKEGRLSVCIANTDFNLKAGESTLIAANQLHSLRSLSPDRDVRYYCLIISPEFLDNCSLSVDDFCSCSFGKCPEIEKLVIQGYQEHQAKAPFYSLIVRAKVTEILAHVMRLRPRSNTILDKPEDKQTEAVKTAIAYINDHLSENITLEDICSHVCLSRYYFSRLFKATTRRTLSDYLLNQRCSFAQTLLQSGNYSIAEVAEKSGFNSSTYFSTSFRRCKGFSPSALVKPTTEDTK